MSDLRHPADTEQRGGSEAIDPESPDFVSQFDREFGAPALEPGAAATATDATDVTDVTARAEPDTVATMRSSGARSLPGRVGRRIIRRPYEWVRRPWPDDRVIQVATTIACLVVTTYIMMQVVHWNPLSGNADLINDDTTPTGGDMGAHVWGPAFLRDHLLPNGQLSGWSMDWYAGL